MAVPKKKKNILSFVLQYDQEISGNIVSRQPHLCLERSFWIFFGVTEISPQRDVKSAKPKDHLWIFGQQRQLQKWGSLKVGYLLVFSSVHLQSPSSKDPYLPEHQDCERQWAKLHVGSPLSWSILLPILIQGPFTLNVQSCCWIGLGGIR